MSKISQFITNENSDIYGIKNLNPEEKAALFALYSRSKGSIKDNLLEMIKDDTICDNGIVSNLLDNARSKASKFHEKWTIQYGHSSIAEHACIHMAIENISILTAKILEQNRIASYTEKSTRYVEFEKGKYYRPENIINSDFGKRYTDLMDKLFHKYSVWLDMARVHIYNQNNDLRKDQVNKKACDIMRYILPVSTLTNLGMTINGRSLAKTISNMSANCLPEAQRISADLLREGTKLLPTLLRHTGRNKYSVFCSEHFKSVKQYQPLEHTSIRTYIPDYSIKILSIQSPLYEKFQYGNVNDNLFDNMVFKYHNNSSYNSNKPEDFISFFNRLMACRQKYDELPEELEHINITFELICDYGAYRDLQRHRMMTMTTQDFTNALGYNTPIGIYTLKLDNEYTELMIDSGRLYKDMFKIFPNEAKYCLPMAYKVRSLITSNLKELCYIMELRTQQQGHESYRTICKSLYNQLYDYFPNILDRLHVDLT